MVMRILFICFPYSVHAARWVGLLSETGWDVHIFPAQEFDDFHVGFRNVTYWPARPETFADREGVRVERGSPVLAARARGELSHVEYLREVLRNGAFTLLHSLEFQHSSYLALEALAAPDVPRPLWIATNYGSDILLYGPRADHAPRIRAILATCDFYSAECHRDVDLAEEMGFGGSLFQICPNSGGIDLAQVERLRSEQPPSARRVIAVKGYEHFAGRALVVLGVLEQVKHLLAGYEIVVYAPSPEVRHQSASLAERTGLTMRCYAEQEAHETILALHGRSRISIANSLSDGISTSLIEAMACGSFPIQSGTACADEWIVDGESGFITDPQDADDIARALTIALQDDRLVDRAAELNARRISARADHRKVGQSVVRAYEAAVATGRRGSEVTVGTSTAGGQMAPARIELVPRPLREEAALRARIGSSIPLTLPARGRIDKPVLTVITPTYNRAAFLPETIDSVLSQSFSDFEYLIIDDGSSDNTAEVVATYRDDRIRYWRHENCGESRTVNRALLQVTGDFFTIVNSDDPCVEHAFAKLLSALATDDNALMAYPDWYLVDEASTVINRIALPGYDIASLLTSGSVALGPGALFRSTVLDLVGLRDPTIRYSADLDYIYRLSLCGPMVHVAEFLGVHRVHPGSTGQAGLSERFALDTLYPYDIYARHPLLPPGLKRNRRRAFATGSMAAAFVTPDPWLACRLLARGFLTDPVTLLRQMRDHGSDDMIGRLEAIGAACHPATAYWLDRALAAPTRRAALQPSLRAILKGPAEAVRIIAGIGIDQVIEHIRTLPR